MYMALNFKIRPLQPTTDILIAQLSELGFEGFEETGDGLQAYIPESAWKQELLQEIQILKNGKFEIGYQVGRLPRKNWNAVWEKSFQPIAIGRDCLVRAPFHKGTGAAFEIVIEPKMSFGTGHHETTRLMLEWLLELEVSGRAVLDMGCGTGVLGILAAMRGAGSVEAIDNDPWCYANARENAARNGQDFIQIREGDAGLLENRQYDIILANINRNILLEDLPRYAGSLNRGGILLLSGFYLADLPAISEKCGELNLKFEKNKVLGQWVSPKYVF